MEKFKINLFGKEIEITRNNNGKFVFPYKELEPYKTALKPAHEPIVVAQKPLEKGLNYAQNILKWGVGALNIDETRIGFEGDDSDSRIGTKKTHGESKKHIYNEIENKIIEVWKTDEYDYIWSETGNNIEKIAERFEIKLPEHYKNYERVIFALWDTTHNFIDYDFGKLAIPFDLKSTSKGLFGQVENSKKDIQMYKEGGRYPANVIHDNSQEVKNAFPDTKKGGAINKDYKINNNIYGDMSMMTSNHIDGFGDSGSASRFFYGAKAQTNDRDQGLDYRETQTVNDGREKTADNAYQRGATERKNIHPTVKPTDLMRYLVRMVTPKNGTVADIFMGSGSTGKGAMVENILNNKNYKFIGFELTEEYLPIARDRIIKGSIEYANEEKYGKPKPKKVNDKQMKLF